jgi:OOP family OmpA-OmpF porin
MNRKAQEDCSDFEELRRLLMGPELEKLEELNHRLESPENFSSEVGEILPRAMAKSSQQGEQLSEAMLPMVKNILRLSIKRDINEIADALFPVIGPAIRMAIRDAFSQMLQSLNQTLESSFSFQGLKWRLQSMRTGIPFAQIALLHGLVYRVEQVFLIHKDTGLLLNHLVQQDIEGHNADLVSSMLSAIENFVGDSFEAEGNRTLDSIEVGELSIWIEQGPDAILAVAIRGEAPNSLRTLLKQALEKIQYEFGDSLAAFDGDTSKFEETRLRLADCMQSQYRSQRGEKSGKGTIVLVLLSILLLYWLGMEFYRSTQENEYVAFVKNEPGYVVTDVYRDDGRLHITGLRDPLATEPEILLSKSSLNSDQVGHRFQPYHSLEAVFIGRRAEKILQPPTTVSIRIEGDKLVAEGIASRDWRERLGSRVALLAGINSIDDSGLRAYFEAADLNPPDGVTMQLEAGVVYIEGRADNAWISSLDSRIEAIDEIDSVDTRALVNLTEERLVAEIEALEKTVVYFESATATDFDTTGQLGIPALAKNIVNLANNLSRNVLIIVRGFSDSAANYEDNRTLSLKRAQHIAQFLLGAGIDSRHLEIKGIEAPVAKENSNDEKRYNRRVTFEVHIE